MEYGLVGLVILILDIFAIIKILGSSAGTGPKVIWTLVVLFFPLLGLIAWWFAGPRG